MTAGDPPAADIAEPVQRYEQLRARALAGQADGFRLGLAVLRRNGVAAWMQTWAAAPIAPRRCLPAPEATADGGGRNDEVVAVLAAMALACAAGG